MFITFEGIEGSGKSTQIRLLAEALKGQGRDVVVTREPGGTPIGDQIRKILLDGANKGMDARCELLLYWAARAQHVEELIKPALKAGKIVLCDRYVDSTVAYQGYARGLDFAVLDFLKKLVAGSVRVDKTLLCDLPAEAGLARAKGRIRRGNSSPNEDRFENEELSFHEKVRRGFLDMARAEPDRFAVIDVTRPKEAVHREILGVVTEALAAKKSGERQ